MVCCGRVSWTLALTNATGSRDRARLVETVLYAEVLLIYHITHFICSKITVKAEVGKYDEQDSKAEL